MINDDANSDIANSSYNQIFVEKIKNIKSFEAAESKFKEKLLNQHIQLIQERKKNNQLNSCNRYLKCLCCDKKKLTKVFTRNKSREDRNLLFNKRMSVLKEIIL